MAEKPMRFGFGKNWEKFIEKHFSDERVELSKQHLLDFLQMDDLQGKYFLDVGCGSGLHSLAALRLGAAKIVSFDFDPDSVNTTNQLRQYAGNPSHWTVKQGSILDKAFLQTIEPADIVYSWGVLHHTGKVWQALENTAQLMNDQALFYVALYSGEPPYFDRPGEFWLEVKQSYNQASWLGKKKMELWYFWEFFLQKKWSNLPNLFKQAQAYKARGMEMYTDAVDWLGGWPMEFVPVEAVKRFGNEQLGLTLVNIKTGQANVEYLFGRQNNATPTMVANSTDVDSASPEYKPVNFNARQTTPETLRQDVEYATQIGQNFIRLLPEGHASLPAKVVLEVGPGINFGSTLLMACLGAKVMVADRFLAPWDEQYHPVFYALLRDWVKENIPEADLTPLDRILAQGGYCPESIRCYSTSLEDPSEIPQASVDIIFSNAVLEHIYDPLAAFENLARISRLNALGYHQVDFRDHRDFSRPLEYLLMADNEFNKAFVECHGECGNRYRPDEYTRLFEQAGFQVHKFVPSCSVEEPYLKEFIPRLRAAKGSKYQNTPVSNLQEVGGYYVLEKLPDSSVNNGP